MPYPLYRRLGGHQAWSGQVWKILPALGFYRWTVQPVARKEVFSFEKVLVSAGSNRSGEITEGKEVDCNRLFGHQS
jgi:hypothetical protein